MEALERADVFAFDFETRELPGYPDNQDTKTDPFRSDIEWVSVSVDNGRKAWDWPIQRGEDPIESLRPFLDDPTKLAVAHNAKFELKYILKECDWYIPKAKVICTQVAAWMLMEDRKRYALKTKRGDGLAQEILKMNMISYDEAYASRQGLFPTNTWSKYCQDDSVAALRLWERFRKRLENEGMLKLFLDVEMPCTPVIAEMEMTGVHLDHQKLVQFQAEFEELLRDVTAQIYQEAGEPVNIGSPDQLAHLLFTKMKCPTDGIDKGKKSYSTGEEALKILSGKGYKIADLILEYRRVSTQLKNFFRPLVLQTKTNPIIYPSASQTGTKTGRWAYSRPNITQFTGGHKSPLRFAVVPAEGMQFVGGDLSQAELRLMAHRSRDPVLLENYMDAVADLHTKTAEKMGVDRKLAKNLNFGLIYGMGAKGLKRYLKKKADMEISEDAARQYRFKFFETYRGLQAYYKRVEEYVREHKCMRDICGRVRHLASVMREDESAAFRYAVNYSIQASVGSVVKIAIRNIVREARNLGIYGRDKFHLLYQVHDELIGQAPPEYIEPARELMKREMENAVKIRVPMVADIVSADSWGSMK